MVFVKGLAAHCARYFVWREWMLLVPGCVVRNAPHFIVQSLQYKIALKWLPDRCGPPDGESR